MNIKIIAFTILSITMHDAFCMIVNPEKTKTIKNIYEAQPSHPTNQKAAEEYLKPFMLRSIVENSRIFSEHKSAVQKAIIRQCKGNNDTSPIIGLIQLPPETQVKIASYLFKNEHDKISTEYLLSIPLELALNGHNIFPEFSGKIKLPLPIILKLTKDQQRILNKIYINQAISTKESKQLTTLENNILEILLQQNLNVTIPENENQFHAWVTTPYHAPKSMPTTERIKLIIEVSIAACSFTCLPIAMNYGKQKIKEVMPIWAITIPLLQLLAYPITEYSEWSKYYNAAITAKITVPLKSLL